METKITCPLGSECEKVVGDHVERCAWYTAVEGKNPQDQTDIKESRCAMSWIPILLIEGTSRTVNVAAAVESLRNETVKRQDAALALSLSQPKIGVGDEKEIPSDI